MSSTRAGSDELDVARSQTARLASRRHRQRDGPPDTLDRVRDEPASQALIYGLGGAGFAVISLVFAAGRVPRNSLVGIRTPWTLRNDYVWSETHRVFGIVGAVLGAGLVVRGLIAPLEPPWLVRGLVIYAMAATAYSYVLSRGSQARARHDLASDELRQFVAESCTLNFGGRETSSDLYRAYEDWAWARGTQPREWAEIIGGLEDDAFGLTWTEERGDDRRWAGITLRERVTKDEGSGRGGT